MRTTVAGFGLGVVVLGLLEQPQKQESLRVPRRFFQDRLIDRFGLGQPPGLLMSQGNGEIIEAIRHDGTATSGSKAPQMIVCLAREFVRDHAMAPRPMP